MRDWEFQNRYEYSVRYGRHYYAWYAVGRHICLHLHISNDPKMSDYGPSGGVETHYRQPPEYMAHKPPDHEQCSAFGSGSPCWHDGSSMWASERWIPMWQFDPNDHEGIFQALNREASRMTNEYLEEAKPDA